MVGLILSIILVGISFANGDVESVIRETASYFCLNPQLIVDKILKESGGRTHAVMFNANRTIDVGVAQINSSHFPTLVKPFLARLIASGGVNGELARRYGLNMLWDPGFNIYVAGWILTEKVRWFGYNVLAVAAYTSATHLREYSQLQAKLKAIREGNGRVDLFKDRASAIKGGKCVALYVKEGDIYVLWNPRWCFLHSGFNTYDFVFRTIRKPEVIEAPLSYLKEVYPISEECDRVWNYGYRYWKREGDGRIPERFKYLHQTAIPLPPSSIVFKAPASHPLAGVNKVFDLNNLKNDKLSDYEYSLARQQLGASGAFFSFIGGVSIAIRGIVKTVQGLFDVAFDDEKKIDDFIILW